MSNTGREKVQHFRRSNHVKPETAGGPIVKSVSLDHRIGFAALFFTYALFMRYVLGFDGGGTKTECVLMDETGAILARSRSGPSNAVNVGPEAAAAALAEAGKEALRSAAQQPASVAFVLAGISGAGEPAVQAEIKTLLQPTFPKASIVITSDLPLTLAATGEIPSAVVIAGTGSAVLGRTAPLKLARAGGFGPRCRRICVEQVHGRHVLVRTIAHARRGARAGGWRRARVGSGTVDGKDEAVC